MAAKQPTNKDLSKDLKEVKGMVATIAGKVETLWDWRLEQQAIDNYIEKHRSNGKTLNQDLIKAILIALGVISTLVTAYLTIKPKQ